MLNYGENDDCYGELLGEEGKGLAVMFNMMNEARISVGLIATALGYAGYAKSLRYARERVQGRSQTTGEQVAIVEHDDVKRMLLVQKAYNEGALNLCLFASHLHDTIEAMDSGDERREALSTLLGILTPIVKSWPSEWCLESNKWAIQIHGGYGYTRDFDVEQHYRDNRLNMIHEGTNGIQALDLLGRKMRDWSVLREAMDADVQATIELIQDASGEDVSQMDDAGAGLLNRLTHRCGSMSEYVQLLDKTTKTLEEVEDRATKLVNAAEYLNMAGHVVIAWRWLVQERAAVFKLVSDLRGEETLSEDDKNFYLGKLMASQFFFHHELPKTLRQASLLESHDDTCAIVRNEFF